MLAAKGRQARQVALLDQLQRSTAAGRNVVHSVGKPELAGRRRTVASTHHREATAVGHGLGDGTGPAANRGSSNTPMGPFHNTVRASAITSQNSTAEPGPMSRPIQPSGIDVPTWRTSPPADGSPILPPGPSAVISSGSRIGAPESSSRAQSSIRSSSSSDEPTLAPLRRQEGEAHPAATQ